ncbi:Alpha/beta hydrolase family protein [Aquisphaera giovannonii]|uniref:Alpha/beta hydrolase family protein n=1 Tax=Aquisphaera giovannonii TaxID=406548 RepID=A0A5B9W7Z9_9BACT|nr:alpha/beta fold hydrolase [Aquisphaera giovannonii]QEH36215.1 Alpha/beta hydrolase family protein [Aquisphaera giovannonii]
MTATPESSGPDAEGPTTTSPAAGPRRRRRHARGAAAALIVLAMWMAASCLIAYRLTRRSRARFDEPAPAASWGPIEGLRLATSDGHDIGGWFADGRDPAAPSVLLIHGNKGSRGNSLKRAGFLAAEGFAVMMISLRAHGDSSGDSNDFGLSARRDVVAAVESLERRRPGRPIVVLGTSLGSAAASFASGELGRRVSGYILEAPFADLKTAVWNRTHTYLPPVLAPIAYAGLRAVGPLFVPELDRISPLDAIRGVPSDVPVLIIAGEADTLATPDEARAFLRAVDGHGELILFPGAHHNNLYSSDPGRYERAVLDFCRRAGRAG